MDELGAIVAALNADTAVHAAAPRIWGAEMPDSEAPNMPRANVVVTLAGGGMTGGADKEWSDARIDVTCFGSSLRASKTLYDLVRTALANLERQTYTVGGVPVFLHDFHESTRAITTREPDTRWPVTIGSWMGLIGE